MFIQRVNLELSQKLGLTTTLVCRNCHESATGYWNFSSDSQISSSSIVCTKCLTSNVLGLVKDQEHIYSVKLGDLCKWLTIRDFIRLNSDLKEWTLQNFVTGLPFQHAIGYNKYCDHKGVYISYKGSTRCKSCFTNAIEAEIEVQKADAREYYENEIQMTRFLKDLQKELQDPEYCSELLE